MQNFDKRQEVGELIFTSKYARTFNGKKESWEDAIGRVMKMHWDYIKSKLSHDKFEEFKPLYSLIFDEYLKRDILGAQRALQFGGDQLLKNHTRLYNCSGSYINRPDFFKELMFILLSGAGAGYSVQKVHIDQLPIIQGTKETVTTYVIGDSIEEWSNSVGELINSYFYNKEKVIFDFSQIRPKGAPISGGFKAPGPEPLKIALIKVEEILKSATSRKLRPYEAHKISCILADAVISGGIRRSALLCLFDADDEDMLTCKTGNWWHTNPEFARANNSAVILPTTPKATYDRIYNFVKEFGEPGFAFLKNADFMYNPCFEVAMQPMLANDYKLSGWSFCNLTNTNVSHCKTLDDLVRSCKAAAYFGTIQAYYTDFNYLGDITKQIVERDALIGVGLTGMAENPHLIFNAENQQIAAKAVLEANKEMAAILGINPAARTTVVKPDGNTSQLLGSSSGIHSFEARRYLRHIQLNNNEQILDVVKKYIPKQVEKSYEKPNQEHVVFFPVKVPDDALIVDDISAIEFLELVKLTQNNWIEYGTNKEHPTYKLFPDIRMNVSNTCKVAEDEWDTVQEYLWNNKEYFCGVSLLSKLGDIAFRQAPYTKVYDEQELAKLYGAGAILGGGLIVDGLKVFNNLWDACDAALGYAPQLLTFNNSVITNYLNDIISEDYTVLVNIDGVKISDINAIISNLKDTYDKRNDWVRRFKKFSCNYMNCNDTITAECLKRVSIYHKWIQSLDSTPINWNSIEWENVIKTVGSDTAGGCSGGACEIVTI